METTFRELAELCEKLESTTKRNLMVNLVSEFIKKLSVEEVEPAISMILGRPFPKWDQRTLEISWATISSIIRKLTSLDWKFFLESFNETGDVGEATRRVFEKSKMRRQSRSMEEKQHSNINLMVPEFKFTSLEIRLEFLADA